MKTIETSRRTFLSFASSLITGSALGGMYFTFLGPGKKSREEVYKQLDELVDKYMSVYGTCSQTSFCALNETFGLKADVIVKALASFPGIAFRGETCGAVSGSLMAIALIYEAEKIDYKKYERYSTEPSGRFCLAFENIYGSTRCRDVIKYNTGKEYVLTKLEDYAEVSKDGAYKYCPDVLKKAIHIAADIIMEKS